jgi:ABC-type multidrug transport system fused ATPase/permease subunit
MDVVINATTLLLILTQPGVSGAAAGFMLIFAGNITWNVNWLLINLRQFELKGVSLERTTEYRLLPREEGQTLNPNDPGYAVPGEDTESNWPSLGVVEVKDLRVRYGPDMPDILHDVSFQVQGGQRVGIVGATGGGKSTLAKAFFSFVDVTHGSIKIDGRGRSCWPARWALLMMIDIASIPLNQLRSHLGIIAQDPILLSGTLRLNLDIESKYSDQELYDALHQVQLIKRGPSAGSSATSKSEDTVVEDDAQQNIFNNLDSEIKSGGEK